MFKGPMVSGIAIFAAILSPFLAFLGLIYKDFYLPKIFLKRKIQAKFEENEGFQIHVKAANLSHLLQSQDPRDHEEIKRLNLQIKPKPNLIVLIGESGIGKTASISAYAMILRSQGHPVFYYSLSKSPEKAAITLDTFLQGAFGKCEIEEVCEIIEKLYCSKGITPTLIIDDIHFCQNDGKLASDVLTTINKLFYQRLELNIVMLSSVNKFAYRMTTGYFSQVFFEFLK